MFWWPQWKTWLAWVLGVLLGWGLWGGCIKAPDGSLIADKEIAAKHNAQTFLEVVTRLGLRGNLTLTIGPGYAGAFTGAMWDLGLGMTANLELDPEKATLISRIWQMIHDGQSADEILTELDASDAGAGGGGGIDVGGGQ